MAELLGNLWEHNLAHVRIVDVTDDYALMQPPMPSDLYPILKDTWLPHYGLPNWLHNADLLTGYLYDWHESPKEADNVWYVGVVREDFAKEALGHVVEIPS